MTPLCAHTLTVVAKCNGVEVVLYDSARDGDVASDARVALDAGRAVKKGLMEHFASDLHVVDCYNGRMRSHGKTA